MVDEFAQKAGRRIVLHRHLTNGCHDSAWPCIGRATCRAVRAIEAKPNVQIGHQTVLLPELKQCHLLPRKQAPFLREIAARRARAALQAGHKRSAIGAVTGQQRRCCLSVGRLQRRRTVLQDSNQPAVKSPAIVGERVWFVGRSSGFRGHRMRRIQLQQAPIWIAPIAAHSFALLRRRTCPCEDPRTRSRLCTTRLHLVLANVAGP